MKQYIGISRDHSGSMQAITKPAMAAYNMQIQAIKEASQTHGIDTVVSVVKCGIGPGAGRIEREIVNSSINSLKSLTSYPANGGSTPLFDSVVELINIMKTVPDFDDPNVSFLIDVVTDGGDNASRVTGFVMGKMIKEFQNTDRWTFVFRVPRGDARGLAQMGISEGNILEWDQTSAGIARSTEETTKAYEEFFVARKAGKRSTNTFYSDLKNVSAEEIKGVLEDISTKVTIYPVHGSIRIDEFILESTGKALQKGNAFYQLMKPERAVQDYKKICIQDKVTGKIYGGDASRDLLGLPRFGNISLSPGDHGNYRIFIQSTSLNRKLPAGTSVLYLKDLF